MNIRRSFFLDCSPCVISNDKAGPTMKAETNYNTDYSKNALFEKRAKLYSRHSRILELSPLSKEETHKIQMVTRTRPSLTQTGAGSQ